MSSKSRDEVGVKENNDVVEIPLIIKSDQSNNEEQSGGKVSSDSLTVTKTKLERLKISISNFFKDNAEKIKSIITCFLA